MECETVQRTRQRRAGAAALVAIGVGLLLGPSTPGPVLGVGWRLGVAVVLGFTALGVAHAIQCPYCIDAYTKNCLEAGADAEQLTEAVHVASALRGGASLIHGMQMRDHHDSLSM